MTLIILCSARYLRILSINRLFLVNWLMNAHDILNEFDHKFKSATDTTAKIDRCISERPLYGQVFWTTLVNRAHLGSFRLWVCPMIMTEPQSTSSLRPPSVFPILLSDSIFYEKGSCPKRDNRPLYKKDIGSSNKQDRSDSRGRQYNHRGSFGSQDRNNSLSEPQQQGLQKVFKLSHM